MREAVIGVYLFWLSCCDLREKKVPVILLAAGGAATAVACAAECLWGSRSWMEIGCGCVPGCLLLLVSALTQKAGQGDGIVVLLAGALEGTVKSLALLCISLFMMSAVSIVLLALRKVRPDSRLPYIPFLCGAYVLCCLMRW